MEGTASQMSPKAAKAAKAGTTTGSLRRKNPGGAGKGAGKGGLGAGAGAGAGPVGGEAAWRGRIMVSCYSLFAWLA